MNKSKEIRSKVTVASGSKQLSIVRLSILKVGGKKQLLCIFSNNYFTLENKLATLIKELDKASFNFDDSITA